MTDLIILGIPFGYCVFLAVGHAIFGRWLDR